MPIITLTTDFGLSDAYVGTMKGVIAGICPRARVIDLTHGISPGDIVGAAFALATAAPYFPRATIHVAVVDPGVGSARAAIAVRTDRATFIGPDNGILMPAVREHRLLDCRRIENPALCLPRISSTFHGRDVFAPVAAHLASGLNLARIGPRHRNPVQLNWPAPVRERGRFRGEVIAIDRFGNAVSNIPISWLPVAESHSSAVRIQAGKARSLPLSRCYASVSVGKAVGVPGSSGFVEIAVNQGNAAEQLGLARGSKVTVRV